MKSPTLAGKQRANASRSIAVGITSIIITSSIGMLSDTASPSQPPEMGRSPTARAASICDSRRSYSLISRLLNLSKSASRSYFAGSNLERSSKSAYLKLLSSSYSIDMPGIRAGSADSAGLALVMAHLFVARHRAFGVVRGGAISHCTQPKYRGGGQAFGKSVLDTPSSAVSSVVPFAGHDGVQDGIEGFFFVLGGQLCNLGEISSPDSDAIVPIPVHIVRDVPIGPNTRAVVGRCKRQVASRRNF
ncbi:hypothetical protein EMIT0111MI5_50442 [Burkholderia sp. IT-111MI5]